MGQVDVTVSLEPHLVEVLSPLLTVLPPPLSTDLLAALSAPSTNELATSEISHSLLSRISQWSRLPPSRTLLESHNLDPNAYLMISLLAGTKTSPKSRFPRYKAPEQPEVMAKRRLNDKKEITAIVNSLFTVGATGMAVWWAADKVGWRQEWKALAALMAATVVAICEIVLYFIWQSKYTSKRSRAYTFVEPTRRNKKQEDDRVAISPGRAMSDKNEVTNEKATKDAESDGMRRRRVRIPSSTTNGNK